MRRLIRLTALLAVLVHGACHEDLFGVEVRQSFDLGSLIGAWDARFVVPAFDSEDTETMTQLNGRSRSSGNRLHMVEHRDRCGNGACPGSVRRCAFVGSGPPEPCTGRACSGCWDQYQRWAVTAIKDTLFHVTVGGGDTVNLRVWVPITGGHIAWTPKAGAGFNTANRTAVRLYDSTRAGVQELLRRA